MKLQQQHEGRDVLQSADIIDMEFLTTLWVDHVIFCTGGEKQLRAGIVDVMK